VAKPPLLPLVACRIGTERKLSDLRHRRLLKKPRNPDHIPGTELN